MSDSPETPNYFYGCIVVMAVLWALFLTAGGLFMDDLKLWERSVFFAAGWGPYALLKLAQFAIKKKL